MRPRFGKHAYNEPVASESGMNIEPLLGEFLGLFLFVISVGVVFASSIAVLRRIFTKGIKQAKLSVLDILLLFAGFAGVLCIAYGFTEPYKLDTTHVLLRSSKLSAGSHLRIAHISDLHCDGTKRVDDKLIENIINAKPDFVVFTGDAQNNKAGLEQFKKIIANLAVSVPVYACDGNHDTRGGAGALDRYTGTGAQMLNCASTTVNVRGNLVWLGGVAIDSEHCLEATLKEAPEKAYSILLYHFPEGIKEATDAHIDLFCTGHTHGGQVRLPFYGAVITMTSLGKKYEAGLYYNKGTAMYVNRGIGMTGIPVRFLCLPELTIIDVESNQ